MSKTADAAGDRDELTDEEAAFLDEIRETFAPWLKSEQVRDHPETDFPDRSISGKRRHNDGANIHQQFSIARFANYLAKATRNDHAVATYPKALPHLVTHIQEWEKWEIAEDEPEFGDLPRARREVLEWFSGLDDETDDREDARSTRTKRLRPGGTGVILHGEQGTTKTTAMYWLITHIMQINQRENVIWQSTLDDTEWQVFAPWATLCLPAGIDVQVLANPYGREYRDIGAFEIRPEDVSRQVIRYEDPTDLTETMAEREPGQFYVVYPDPKFRKCQALTGHSYESIWDVDASDEATDLNHVWFALMEAIVHGGRYNEWTTLVADEAHKWLRQGKSNDDHDWWDKIDDWATYWGDARKKRLSVILAIHKWHEIHNKVRDKVRWGATMNGEDFPVPAPRDGTNGYDQDLGDMCVWNNTDWNHVGYPDIKRNFSVDASIEFSYPGYESVVEAKS